MLVKTFLLTLLLSFAAIGGCAPSGQPASTPAQTAPAGSPVVAQQYTCPMHPEVVTNAPGKCPKCGMELVPKKTEGGK